MNWTEGNLARHSRGKQSNEVLKRQKQHFAKARSRFLNSNVKKSPITISFLNLEHVQPSQSRSEDLASPTRSSTIPYHGLTQLQKKTPLSLNCGGISIKSGGRHQWNRGTLLPFQDGHFVENRKRHILANIVDEEKAREKRRRLLMKPDWAGLEMQQPIELSFPGQIQASSGRLWSKLSTIKQRSTNKLQVAQDNVSRNKDTKTHQALTSPSQVVDISPIRIHLGSQTITHDIDSDSQLTAERKILPVSPTERGAGRLSTDRLRLQRSHLRDPSDLFRSGTDTYFRPMVTMSQDHLFEDTGQHLSLHDRPEHVVYASPELYEPTPRRIETSGILYRSSSFQSDSDESVHVEVGRPRRRNSSEVADNKRWLDNLEPLRSLLIPLARGSSLLESPPFKQNISPGVSEASSRFDLSTIEKPIASTVDSSSLVARNTSSHPDTVWSSHFENLATHEGPAEKSKSTCIGAPNSASSHAIDREGAWEQEYPSSPSSNLKDYVKPISIMNRSKESTLPHSRDITRKDGAVSQLTNLSSMPEHDDNAAWMKFIFGASDNDLEVYQEAAHLAAEELKPSELSINSTEVSTLDRLSSSSIDLASEVPGVSSGADSNKATASSSVTTELGQSTFRFALPRTFVGKLAESGVVPKGMPPPPAPVVQGKGANRTRGRRGRRKKMCNGRTNIRALPEFDGDPIEE